MAEPIYKQPDAYDLEHEGDSEDIGFFVRLAVEFRPKRVLELACGTGRVTIPLAESGHKHGFDVVGLEIIPEMLKAAEDRRAEAPAEIQRRLTLIQGDMRHWKADEPFDLILTPNSSMCHLLLLEDQIKAWSQARENLAPGGRFVVEVSMPDHAAYAESFQTPPREIVQIDRDTRSSDSDERLIRFRTTRYLAHEQRAKIRFIYDRLSGENVQERFVSDYESHVYYPRELQLLYLHTGFEVEAIYGDHQGRALTESARSLIMIGRKPGG